MTAGSAAALGALAGCGGGGGAGTGTGTGGSGNVSAGTLSEDGMTLTGGDGGATLIGRDGVSAIDAGMGNDTIIGGELSETITGGAGDDDITGGAGDDVIDGGEGMDTAVYSGLRAEYSFSREVVHEGGERIVVHVVSGADGMDRLRRVELLDFGDGNPVEVSEVEAALTSVTGDETGNTLTGEAGPQTIIGGLGDDTIDGGAGRDVAVFARARGTYTVTEVRGADAAATSYSVEDQDQSDASGEGTDTLRNIEVLRFGGVDNAAGDVALDGALVPDVIVGHATDENDLVGGAGSQMIYGGGGGDVISGGPGDDALFGHTLQDGGGGSDSDTAAYVGSRAGFSVSATLDGNGVEVVTVTDTATGGVGEVDEGTDTLRGFEALLFNSGAANAEDRETVALVFGAGGNDESLAGGAGVDLIFGFGGDDAINGMAGNDSISGGVGDDAIDGGIGTDTAVFAGVRTDYRIWRVTGEDGVVRTFVRHKHDSDDAGDDFGLDTLTGVEMARFGSTATVAVNAALVGDDRAPLMVVESVAPRPGAESFEVGAMIDRDVSDWFAAADGADVTYSVSGLAGAMIDGQGRLTATAPDSVGMVTLTVTASDDAGGDYDDVSFEYEVMVDPAAVGLTAGDDTHVDENTMNMGSSRILGLAGNDMITGGAGNDTLFGNSAGVLGVSGERDTAVYVGALADYVITADLHTFDPGGGNETENVPRIFVTDTDDSAPAATPDEGRDTLVGFEVVRFGNVTAGGDLDDVDLLVVRTNATDTDRPSETVAMAEIILGTEEADGMSSTVDGGGGGDYIFGFAGADVIAGGAGDDMIDGGAGDDTLTGGDDDDTISGGAGDDSIDGGMGMDTAVFAGNRTDYRIWQATGEDAVVRTFVRHKRDSDDTGDDFGVDTLTGVEMARFGTADAVAVDMALVGTDRAPLSPAPDATTAATDTIEIGSMIETDVSGWFTAAEGARVTYSVSGLAGAAVDGVGMLSATSPTSPGTVTLTITASDDADFDYDDVSREYVIRVAPAAVGLSPNGDTFVDEKTSDGGTSNLQGLAGNDTITGGAGDDTLYGNSDVALGEPGEMDTAVYLGAVADYSLSAELHTFNADGGNDAVPNVPRITVTHNPASVNGGVNEGTDTLVGFETVQFMDATLPVVRTSASSTERPAAIVAMAEILLGTEGSDDMVDGGGGGDHIFGFAMDDVISGGAGDDVIDGGTGDDTAVFAGSVEGYRISAAVDGANVSFTVMDTDDSAPVSPAVSDEGTDTLIDIEAIRFGADAMSVVQVADITADDPEIIVDLAAFNGSTNAPIDGGGGVDLIFGLGGDDFLSGGAGDDVVDGGMGNDTAVFAGSRSGYAVSAALSGDVLELMVDDTDTVDDMDPATVDDEGMDTLIGVESVRFGTAELAVVRHDTIDADRTDADAEIVAGDNSENGDATDRFQGGGGDDLMFGLDGDDHLEGGAGDDVIDGGVGMDTAYFAGDRADYRIWQMMDGTGPAAVTRTFVWHKFNTGDTGENLGRDTLVNVEMVKFGDDPDVVVANITFDDEPLKRAQGAPDRRTDAVVIGSETDIVVSGWFDSDPDVTVSYTATASSGAVVVNGATVTFTAPAVEGEVTLTVTASDDTPAQGGAVIDYDDFTLTHVVTVGSPFNGNDNRFADLDTPGSENSVFEGLGGDDAIAGGAGDDTLYGNSASVLGVVGESDTALFAGVVEDYAISAELHTFDMGGANEAANTPRITVMDDNATAPAAPAVPNEGTDTLVGFEIVRFQHGTPNDENDDDVLRVFRTDAGDTVRTPAFMMGAEILLGSEAGDGESGGEIDGGDGADHMFGFAGDDFLSGGAGDDLITGGLGDDMIDGGAGAGDIAVFAGDLSGFHFTAASGTGPGDAMFTIKDVVTTGTGEVDEGTDTLTGVENLMFDGETLAVVDQAGLVGASSQIILLSTANDTNFNAGPGKDAIFGFAGVDHINGDAGDDLIYGGVGNDQINGGDDEDIAGYIGELSEFSIIAAYIGATLRIQVTDENASANGNEGIDGLDNIEMIRFSDATVTVVAHDDSRTLSEDVDEFVAGHATDADGMNATDALMGGAGDDWVFGFGGDDFLLGGAGDDTIDGGDGAGDTAVFAGDLSGFLFTSASGTGANDARFTIKDVATIGNGEIDEGTDTLTGVENLMFDGVSLTVVDQAGIVEASSQIIMLSSGNDFGSGPGNTVAGGAGADVMFGFGGIDSLHGGSGNDQIYGGGENDGVIGGPGNDLIYGGEGGDNINGGDDYDIAGYVGALSEFSITVDISGNAPSIQVTDENATANGNEGADNLVNFEELRFSDATVTVVEHDDSRTLAEDANEIVLGNETDADGTSSADALMGGAGDDWVFGFGGNDFLQGGVGNDIVDGGGGSDTAVFEGSLADFHITSSFGGAIHGATTFTVKDVGRAGGGGVDEGTDRLNAIESIIFGGETYGVILGFSGTSVSEIIIADNNDNTVNADAGDDAIFGYAGNDTINGYTGNDMINGGAANDTIDGGADADIAVYAEEWGTGTGYDIFWDYSDRRLIVEDTDTATTNEGRDVLINIETIRFSDRDFTVIDGSSSPQTGGDTHDVIFGDVSAGRTFDGGGGDDFLFGGEEGDNLSGGAGNDTLNGEGNRDTLTGGGGDDTLLGGASTDTAVFEGDLISGFGLGYVIGVTLLGSTLTDIIVRDNSTTGPGAVDEGTDTLSEIEMLQFADSTLTVVNADLSDASRTSAANAELLVGDDTANGSDSSTAIMGGGGDDYILGLDADDHILGGEGDDVIYGGVGSGDTAYFLEDARTDYTIWQDDTGSETITYVRDNDTTSNGDEGTDMLIGVEMVVFGTAAAVTLSSLSSFDSAPAAPSSSRDFPNDGEEMPGDEASAPKIGDDDCCPHEMDLMLEPITPMLGDIDYFGL